MITTRVPLAAWRRSDMALLVLMLLATEEVLIDMDFLLILLLALEKDYSNMIISIKQHSIAFFSAIEPQLESVNAYLGHPV